MPSDAWMPKYMHDRLTAPAKSEIQEWALSVVTNDRVRQGILEQAQGGRLHPRIMELLFYYAYGKPTDKIVHSNGEENMPFVIQRMSYVPEPGSPV